MSDTNFTKEIYKEKVYTNNGNLEVLQQIPAGAISILDIGCGGGDNAALLKRMNKYVVGVTISEEEGKLAEKICDQVIVADIETTDLFLDRKFDAIILSHVCEHLVHPGFAINKLLPHLKDEGVIIVAVPNMAFYKNRIKLLKGDWTFHSGGPFDKTHLHFYSYNSAGSLFDESKVLISRKVAGQLAVPLWPIRKLFPSLCNTIDNTAGKLFPNLFAQQVILVSKRLANTF